MNKIFKSDNELIFEQYNKNIAQKLLVESNNSKLILTKFFTKPHNISINDIHNIDDVEFLNANKFMMFNRPKSAIHSSDNKPLQSNDKRYSLVIADGLEPSILGDILMVDYIFDNVDDLIDYLNENVDDIISNIFTGSTYYYKIHLIKPIANVLGEEVANKIKIPKYYKTIECNPQSNKLAKKVTELCKGKTKTEIIDLLYQMFPYVVIMENGGLDWFAINYHDKDDEDIEELYIFTNIDTIFFDSINDSDDCGVVFHEMDNYVWLIPNMDIFKTYFKDFMRKYANWVYGDKNTPNAYIYSKCEKAAFNICSKFGLSHGEGVMILQGNVHKQFGISDDEYLNLFGDD